MPDTPRGGAPRPGVGAKGKAGTGTRASPVTAAFMREATRPPLTPYEKTAAAAKEIVETDALKRAERTSSLKAARLARDADPVADSAPTGKGKGKGKAKA